MISTPATLINLKSVFLFQFVAHPNSQQLLNVAIYFNVPHGIRTITSIPLNTLLFIVYTILFPCLALFHNLIPCENWLSEMMETPYLKLVSHISQFLVFLILVAASALRSNHIPSAIGKNIAFSLPRTPKLKGGGRRGGQEVPFRF